MNELERSNDVAQPEAERASVASPCSPCFWVATMLVRIFIKLFKNLTKFGLGETGCPAARTGTNSVPLSISDSNRHVTLRAKRKPFFICAKSAAEFKRTENTNVFTMFILEPLMLFACFVAVQCYILKLRLKFAVLRLKNRHFRFCLFKSIKGKRQAFSHNVRDRQFDEGLSGSVKQGHDKSPVSLFNVCDLVLPHGFRIDLEGQPYFVVGRALVCGHKPPSDELRELLFAGICPANDQGNPAAAKNL